MSNENQVKRPKILVTNDDGIQSPAIWAMAEALTALGEVTIAAPDQQYSGAGRSYAGRTGLSQQVPVPAGSRIHAAYSLDGTPAKAVVFGLFKLFPDQLPDLVVSGINYGENPGTCITSSGTVGAAMESAVNGIPALAVSRMVPPSEYMQHSEEIDFSAAVYFTTFFAERMLNDASFNALEMLKVDVPAEATPLTPWKMTRLSRYRYFEPVLRQREDGSREIDYWINPEHPQILPGDDVYALLHEKVVSVTPLTLDMTAPVDFQQLDLAGRVGQ